MWLADWRHWDIIHFFSLPVGTRSQFHIPIRNLSEAVFQSVPLPEVMSFRSLLPGVWTWLLFFLPFFFLCSVLLLLYFLLFVVKLTVKLKLAFPRADRLKLPNYVRLWRRSDLGSIFKHVGCHHPGCSQVLHFLSFLSLREILLPTYVNIGHVCVLSHLGHVWLFAAL